MEANIAQFSSGRLFLIPVDATEASQHSLDWALENLFKEGDEFYFLHVIAEGNASSSMMAGLDGLGGVDSALLVDNSTQSAEDQVEGARAMLDHSFVNKAEAAGARHRTEVVRYTTDTESVGRVVTTRAEELKADAVILVSHNRSRLAEFFIGSVSKFVVQNCSTVCVLLH